jgi:hypothetical protein
MNVKVNNRDLPHIISRHLSEETEDKQDNLNQSGRYSELNSNLTKA